MEDLISTSENKVNAIENPSVKYVEKLEITPEEYMETRVDDQINWLEGKSVFNQKRFKLLRKVEIIAAALIPFLAALTVLGIYGTVIVGLLGIIVTVVASILGLEQYQTNWIEYRVLSESLKREKLLYLTKAEPYASGNGFPLFVQRVEAMLAKENSGWQQTMLTPPPTKKGG